jgi:hypothetical protein
MGFVVHTLHDVFGRDAEQGTTDPDWIATCAEHGWVAISRDRLRHPGERDAVERHRAKVFRIARSARTGDEMIACLTANIHRIVQASRKPGPFIYRVDRTRIERVWPP